MIRRTIRISNKGCCQINRINIKIWINNNKIKKDNQIKIINKKE
jgi:hypothetical protein